MMTKGFWLRMLKKQKLPAEKFLKHNEAFIRKLLENKDRKHPVSNSLTCTKV